MPGTSRADGFAVSKQANCWWPYKRDTQIWVTGYPYLGNGYPNLSRGCSDLSRHPSCRQSRLSKAASPKAPTPSSRWSTPTPCGSPPSSTWPSSPPMTPWSPAKPSLQAMPPPRPPCTPHAPAWSTVCTAHRPRVRSRPCMPKPPSCRSALACRYQKYPARRRRQSRQSWLTSGRWSTPASRPGSCTAMPAIRRGWPSTCPRCVVRPSNRKQHCQHPPA